MKNLALLFSLTLLCFANAAQAEPAPPIPVVPVAPVIDVFTMGPGNYLFSRFGHAAICVTDADSPSGRCYNYGTADFSTPGPLTWGIVRGNADFWVSVVPLARMLAIYTFENRTLYRQRLPLDEAAARKLVTTLHAADVRSATLYHYHHFNDNCTTRIRDLIDSATGGKLGGDTKAPLDPPLRSYVYAGLLGESPALAVSELALGRLIDRPSSRWQGMFLPSVLRAEITRNFGAPVEVLYERGDQGTKVPSGHPRAGTLLLAFLGLALAGLILLGARIGRPRLGRTAAALPLGVIALALVVVAVASPAAELRYNEVLLILWPTDLLLPFLSRRATERYCLVRLVGLALCLVASLLQLLIQPLAGPLLLAALPLLAAWAIARFWK